jgi:hypothetical protein
MLVPVTENGEYAKTIAAAMAPLLKSQGFRKRANSFNRQAADGLVHHVSVHLGAFDPSGIHNVPGLLRDTYGMFSIRLGVFIPAMERLRVPVSSWVASSHCSLRWDLGTLSPSDSEMWWDLRDRFAVEEVCERLLAVGFPQLDLYRSAESVVAAYESRGHGIFGPTANNSSAIDIADLLIDMGDRVRAEAVLSSYVDTLQSSNHDAHKEYFRELLLGLGFVKLAARVS